MRTIQTNSSYLSKSDLGEDKAAQKQGRVLTISSFDDEEIDGETKCIMYFDENVKPMVLNNTNQGILGALFDDSFDGSKWDETLCINKKITVFVDPTISFGGKVVGGMRVRAALDEDVPF